MSGQTKQIKKSSKNTKYCSIGQASELLGVSIATLRRWEKAGKIKAERLDGKNRSFKVADLEKLSTAKPLSTAATAKQLRISESSVRRLQQKGELVGQRGDNGKYLFNQEAIDTYKQLKASRKASKAASPSLSEMVQQEAEKRLEQAENFLEDENEGYISPAEIPHPFFGGILAAVATIALLITPWKTFNNVSSPQTTPVASNTRQAAAKPATPIDGANIIDRTITGAKLASETIDFGNLSKEVQKKLANNPITNTIYNQYSTNAYNTTNVYNTTYNTGGNTIIAGTGMSSSTSGTDQTLSVNYGSTAGTAAEGNKAIICPSGTGNLTGGGNSVTIGAGGTCNSLGISNNPTFTGQVTAGSLSTDGQVTFSGLGTGLIRSSATGALSTNFVQNSDFDSSQIYSNITKLNNVTVGGQLTVSGLANGIVKSNAGVLTGGNTVTLGSDTTGSYIQNLGSLTGLTTSGNTGAGSTPTIAVAYGSTANTSVQGNTTLICPSGTGNLTGTGNTITLGSGGTCNSLSIVNNPTFSGLMTSLGVNAGTGSIQGTGGVSVTGNSTITGTLSGLTGLTVASGGANITGNSSITGTLSGLTGLTVASGGASIAGDSLITGILDVSGNLSVNTNKFNVTASSGDTTIAGTLAVSGNTLIGPSTNSSTAFSVQNATGVSIMSVDTLNEKIIIGSPTYNVSTISTADLYSFGYSQSILLQSGNTDDGGTGYIRISSGNASNMSSGNVYIDTGNAGAGFNPGAVNIGGNASTVYIQSPTTIYSSLTVDDLNSDNGLLKTDATNMRVSIGSIGTPTGQLYVSGNVPTSAVGSVITGNNPWTVYVQGKYAYVANTGSNTLQIFDVSNPSSPTQVGSVATGSYPKSLYVQGRYAYVANYSSSTLQIFDISNPSSPTSVSTTSTGAGSNPYSVYVQGRYAYVANYSSNTMQIFDISNPSSPTQVSSTSTTGGAISIYVQGRYAYLTNATANTMQIFDISNPANPGTVGSVATSEGPRTVFVQGRYAYIVSFPSTGSNTLQIFDVGGAYVQQLEAGGTETGTLQVNNNASINGSAAIQGGLNVGNSLQVAGDTGINGNMNIAAGSTLSTPATPTLVYTATGGLAANNYVYKVAAFNANGNSVASANSASQTAASNSQITVNWGAVTGATGYVVYRSIDGGSTWFSNTVSTNQLIDNGSNYNWAISSTPYTTANAGGNIITGGNFTSGGNLTFSGTTARTITGPTTGGLTATVASGPLTLSTTTSGTLAVTSAGALNLTGASASTWNVNGTLSLQTTNNGAITTGSGLFTSGGNLTFSGTTARTITGPTTGGLTATVASGPLTLSTTTSGTLAVTSAGALNLTGASASTWSVGSTNALTVTSSNLNVSAAGVLTLAGGQSRDISSSNAIVIGPQNTASGVGKGLTLYAGATSDLATGGTLSLNGGNSTGGFGNGGAVTITGGAATITTGTGGAININGGTGIAANGSVNIGTTTTNQVTIGASGTNTRIYVGATQSTNGLCADTTSASSYKVIYDCSGTPSDYAESYPVTSGIVYGDIVVTGSEMVNTYALRDENTQNEGDFDWSKPIGEVSRLIKSSSLHQNNTIGIVSNNYHDFTSAGKNIKPEDNPMPVALNGRVPVNMAPDSEPVSAGDYLTTSGTYPGKATKATGSGYVIGKALAGWNTGQEQVMVFVEPGYNSGPSTLSYIQDGGSATLVNLTVSGVLEVKGLLKVADIEVNGHIITRGDTPQITAKDAAGTGASVSIEGNDTSGTITINSGSGANVGDLAEITFAKSFGSKPRVILSASNDKAAKLQFFKSASKTGFVLKAADGAGQTSDNTNYEIDYQIMQ